MVDPASVNSSGGTNQADANSSANASRPAKGAELDASTQVSNMGQLKERAPQVYKAIEHALAQNIMTQMRHHSERLKEILNEARYS